MAPSRLSTPPAPEPASWLVIIQRMKEILHQLVDGLSWFSLSYYFVWVSTFHTRGLYQVSFLGITMYVTSIMGWDRCACMYFCFMAHVRACVCVFVFQMFIKHGESDDNPPDLCVFLLDVLCWEIPNEQRTQWFAEAGGLGRLEKIAVPWWYAKSIQDKSDIGGQIDANRRNVDYPGLCWCSKNGFFFSGHMQYVLSMS